MTNSPQILDGTLTIAEDGTTWILTASEIRALQAARERSSQFASAAFLAVVLLVIVLIGALIAAPALLL